MRPGPLTGVKVVELGIWVAGPACGGVLADWGADVVKVESPDGDPQRNVFGAIGVKEQTAVPPFEIDNRGKKSVVINLRSEEGMTQMMTMFSLPTCALLHCNVWELTHQLCDKNFRSWCTALFLVLV